MLIAAIFTSFMQKKTALAVIAIKRRGDSNIVNSGNHNKSSLVGAQGIVSQRLIRLWRKPCLPKFVMRISGNDIKSLPFIVFSGCWELNPVYLLPKQMYYRYTTARENDEPQSRRLSACPP